MKLEMLIRLIEAADPSQLVELAMQHFRRRGYAPVVRDGPGDGAVDLRLFEIGGARRIAVQVTRQKRGLFSKLRADALSAEALGVRQLWVVSSHRLAEAQFLAWSDKIYAETGVQLSRVDAQGLASAALADHAVAHVLHALGVSVPTPRSQPPPRADLKADLTCAFAFFGPEPNQFRESVFERAVIGVVCAEGQPMELSVAISQAAQAVGLVPAQHGLLAAAADRLRQRGVLLGRNGVVEPSADARADWDALRASGRATRAALVEDLGAAFTGRLAPRDVPEMVDLAMGAVGAFAAFPAEALAATDRSRWSEHVRPLGAEARERLARLRTALELAGIAGAELDNLIRRVADLAASSVWARTLAAGDLLAHLATVTRGALARALAGADELQVVLDPSVAMPMLCVTEYGPVPLRFFEAAAQLERQLHAARAQVLLPRPYLEEMAAHLIAAWDDYAAIIDLGDDLRGSKNSFVSHYAAWRTRDGADDAGIDFDAYVSGLGLVPALRSGDREARRNAVMRRLERLWARRGVTIPTPSASTDAHRLVQENLSYMQRDEYEADRAQRRQILMTHDAEVLAWLESDSVPPTHARVMCSWDRLVFRYWRETQPQWDAIDPLALGDALALVGSDPDAAPAVAGAIANDLALAEVERAARIWDTLAGLEKGRLADAELRRKAESFKNDYLTRKARVESIRAIQDEWEAWKRRG